MVYICIKRNLKYDCYKLQYMDERIRTDYNIFQTLLRTFVCNIGAPVAHASTLRGFGCYVICNCTYVCTLCNLIIKSSIIPVSVLCTDT